MNIDGLIWALFVVCLVLMWIVAHSRMVQKQAVNNAYKIGYAAGHREGVAETQYHNNINARWR